MSPPRLNADTPPRRRTQVERRSDAEAKLISSAIELIAEQGAERTSLAQIGERAGFSRGIVNHHFGSKAELFKRLVTESQDRFTTSVPQPNQDATGLESLLALVQSYLQPLERLEPYRRAFLIMWAEAAGTSRDLRPSFVDGDRRFRGWLRRVVEEGQADGSIRTDVDAGAVAAGLVAQLRGLGLELLVDPDAFAIPTTWDALITTIRNGLAGDGGELPSTRRRQR